MQVVQIYRDCYVPGAIYTVWEIKTNGESREEVLKYIRENVHKVALPSMAEWSQNIVNNDMYYYFCGCYVLEEIEGGYRYMVRTPRLDN